MKTVNEVFNEWLTGGGIFESLDDYNVPWKNENISRQLDLQYHGNHSGNKYISPLVDTILGDNEHLTDANVTELAGVVFALNAKNWAREWATMSFVYDPIENYSMVEEMTNDNTTHTYGKTHTRTDSLLHSETITTTNGETVTSDRTPNLSETRTADLTETDTKNFTDTETKNLTTQETKNLTDTSETTTYGFNSSTGVPETSTSEGHTGTDTTVESGTDAIAHTGTDTKTTTGTDTMRTTGTDHTSETKSANGSNSVSGSNTGTVGDVDGGTDTDSHSYHLTRSGNIGVTTSQQMIQSERELYMWNFFVDVVFPSIDKVIALPIY